MKKKNIAVFITVLLLLTATASTPVFSQFGKNKVQYKIFDWKMIQTEHFDIYFDKSNYDLAVYTAHVAESSLVSLSRNLDYNIFDRITLIVFASHNEFQQNNIIDELLPEGVGGVTELFKNRVLVPFEGSFEQFRHVIHHELVHAFINDMFYGGSIQNIISKNITLNLPLWFNEGMAEVQSLDGMDKATDMYIRDAILNNNLPPMLIPFLPSFESNQVFVLPFRSPFSRLQTEIVHLLTSHHPGNPQRRVLERPEAWAHPNANEILAHQNTKGHKVFPYGIKY